MPADTTYDFPYKLQVFLPEHLRVALKRMARAEDTSLQKLVTALLSVGTHDAKVLPLVRKYLADNA